MNRRLGWTTMFALAIGAAAVQSATAAEILVTDNITMSETWTADNTYNLQNQIFVMPGASLTIEAGTVVASTPTMTGSGSLAVTRGGQIFINGTASQPVIMTSTADVATWTVAEGGAPDPSTGVWRLAANEWGNLTLMGNGLISASHFGGNPVIINGVPNTKWPTGENQKQMEGLEAAFEGDTTVLYGGADDDDDSGSISHVSIRYAGRVIGQGNELNGLSLGAIGRATDISYVDIMNNVDDGVEIWGGTVEVDHLNVWNIGDDSIDCDEGFRGKIDTALIVQGYSLDADQGSGVGDNCFETDGAEDSDAQPVSTAVISNATVVGQPFDGDGGTVWRDNARIQYHNCIWMDVGAGLVQFDNIDGDGGQGYGLNGTLSWADTWTTSYTHSQDLGQTINGCDEIPVDGCSSFNTPAALYQSQTSGNLAEIRDSLFYNVASYATSDSVGVTVNGDDNPALNNIVSDLQPVTSITRETPIIIGNNKVMARVLDLDPTPAGDAVGLAEGGQSYRGAFAPGQNWLIGWTAADAFGLTEAPCPWDCADPHDGIVGINDFLALLSEWGMVGSPCDGTGGGVGINDFLALLAAWGACP